MVGIKENQKPFNVAFENSKATLVRCKLPQKHRRRKEQEHCGPRGRGIQSNLCAKIVLMNRNSKSYSYEQDSFV